MSRPGSATSPVAPREESLPAFRDLLAGYRERLEPRLRSFLEEKRREVVARSGARDLVDAVQELVEGGGKRLRPALVHYSCRACGGDTEAVEPLALSTELLHSYLLIHDDIMDRAEVRRGRRATHLRFAEMSHGEPPGDEGEHFGRSAAILAGDLAHSWAVELYLRARPQSKDGTGLDRAFSQMCQEVVDGQYGEMLLAGRQEPGEEELLRVLRLKSGRYSVERPIELGARFAGAGAPRLEALGRYGSAVGEAFQLQDDVLGTFGEEEATGKPVSADLSEGKFTFLVHHALRGAEEAGRERLREILERQDLEAGDVDDAREIIRRSGGLEAVREMIDARLGRAAAALEEIDLRPEDRTVFDGLLEYMGERER